MCESLKVAYKDKAQEKKMMGKAEEVEHGNICTLIIFPDDVRFISPVLDIYSSNSDPSSYSL